MQRSFDDLGTPLEQVTFCVIDLETTGGSAADGGITEIGAVKVRAGEVLGTLQTFVNPGHPVPRQISMLTGITDSMVATAPSTSAVLPHLLEFVGEAVVVGHNVRYDLGYLNAALEREGRDRLPNRSIDTLALARRLVRDEVRNCSLGTLAGTFRLDHRPSHRALADALATVDLLHLLIERAAAFGVRGLDDLAALPSMGAHPQAAKLRLTDNLPRSPGVYVFRDRRGEALYVGKATNLRSRVRSYFSTDDRRKVGQLLRETERIDHSLCPSPLEAAVLEVRLIHRWQPRFNRQAKDWQRYVYLKLTTETFPRLSVVRVAKDDGALYLGPLPSTRVARLVADAIETAVPLRRCTAAPHRATRTGPCAPAQLGVAHCPCADDVTPDAYAAVTDLVRRGVTGNPEILLAPLEARMHSLAAMERFEEAADVRDRAAALSRALRRQHRLDVLRRSGRVVLEFDGRSGVELMSGRLVRSWRIEAAGTTAVPLPIDLDPASPERSGDQTNTTAPLDRALADELTCVAAWLDKEYRRIQVVSADGPLTSDAPPIPTFEPA
ncbi:MAG: DEDD exonuclease domain-containing protein [Acidimicrobiales bacterium]|nr:DEDD exonuclease domain-containing protein [Acidimicrobiales bacterium]